MRRALRNDNDDFAVCLVKGVSYCARFSIKASLGGQGASKWGTFMNSVTTLTLCCMHSHFIVTCNKQIRHLSNMYNNRKKACTYLFKVMHNS